MVEHSKFPVGDPFGSRNIDDRYRIEPGSTSKPMTVEELRAKIVEMYGPATDLKAITDLFDQRVDFFIKQMVHHEDDRVNGAKEVFQPLERFVSTHMGALWPAKMRRDVVDEMYMARSLEFRPHAIPEDFLLAVAAPPELRVKQHASVAGYRAVIERYLREMSADTEQKPLWLKNVLITPDGIGYSTVEFNAEKPASLRPGQIWADAWRVGGPENLETNGVPQT